MRITARSKAKAAEHNIPLNSIQITLSDDVDVDALSKLIPEINLTSLSSDDILFIYQLLVSQLTSLDSAHRERDEARAETERKDVELDQALQDKESLTNDFEASVESVNKELQQVKQEREQLGSYSFSGTSLSILLIHSFNTHSERQDSLATSNHNPFRLSALLNL
jgi:nucleoprotein TPR